MNTDMIGKLRAEGFIQITPRTLYPTHGCTRSLCLYEGQCLFRIPRRQGHLIWDCYLYCSPTTEKICYRNVVFQTKDTLGDCRGGSFCHFGKAPGEFDIDE